MAKLSLGAFKMSIYCFKCSTGVFTEAGQKRAHPASCAASRGCSRRAVWRREAAPLFQGNKGPFGAPPHWAPRPVLGWERGHKSLIPTTPSPGGVCSAGVGLPDTPTTHQQRGESLAFEQIRRTQLPPTPPLGSPPLLGPAHASLGHLSCVPAQRFPHAQ